MKVIDPLTVTDAMLISSTVAEPASGETAWSGATAYTVGQIALRTATHRLYRRLVAGTTATAPELDVAGVAGVTAPNWEDYAPSRRWAMFDQEINTATTDASSLTVVLAPGICNSLALLELVGSSVTITVTDGAGGPTVYTRTVALDTSLVTDWYQYFFEPFSTLGTLVLNDLPPYANARITVALTGLGTVALGQCIAGSVYPLGLTQLGVSAGIRDYSRKEVDPVTGAVSLERRKFSRTLRARFSIEPGAVNAVHARLSNLRAKPCVWIADDDRQLDPLVVFGFYKDFSLDVAYAARHFYSLDIEGMT